MHVREILKDAVTRLVAANIPTPELDARVLLEHASGKTREYFLAYPDAEIDEAEFLKLLQRRLKREPISHITGRKEFYGREFKVSADVLTPRPDTETIIEAAKAHFKPGEKLKILDLGTGSGCILLTLLKEFPASEGVGVDISNNALAIARQNAYNLGIQGLKLLRSDWTKELSEKEYDLVVSNPPYIKAEESKTLEAELGYEPETALYAGIDGLDAYRKIAGELKSLSFRLAMLEIGINQEVEVEQIFKENGFRLIEAKKDIASIVRVLIFTR